MRPKPFLASDALPTGFYCRSWALAQLNFNLTTNAQLGNLQVCLSQPLRSGHFCVAFAKSALFCKSLLILPNEIVLI